MSFCRSLQQVNIEIRRLGEEIIKHLEKLEVSGRPRKLGSFRQALRTVWSDDELDSINQRLEKIRQDVNTQLLGGIQ
jgi:hypothetical protein